MHDSGHMYILLCADDSYYTGSTIDLNRRLAQHQKGEGANHTKNRLPVVLVYSEYFERIEDAFRREKQIQKWSRKKKEALINGDIEKLKKAAECQNETHHSAFDSAQASFDSALPEQLSERSRRQSS